MPDFLPTTITDDDELVQTKLKNTKNAPQHLNSAGCIIKCVEGKGRGVFGVYFLQILPHLLAACSTTDFLVLEAASHAIPAWTTIEISPVLLLSSEEYELHGRHTVLDHYTFKWRDGRMALALGLGASQHSLCQENCSLTLEAGSLFNHSQSPNISFTLDPTTDSIKYTTSRQIESDEELCIFYGHTLWFDTVDAGPSSMPTPEPDDGWGGLGSLGTDIDGPHFDEDELLVDENPEEPITEEELPFIRVRITPDDDEEENPESIRTSM